jgi:hypothetical protein
MKTRQSDCPSKRQPKTSLDFTVILWWLLGLGLKWRKLEVKKFLVKKSFGKFGV